MPAKARKQNGKNRVVDVETGKLVKTAAGKPVDGGGHESLAMAQRQASAINISQARQRGANIPFPSTSRNVRRA